jgi:hypothetical protein
MANTTDDFALGSTTKRGYIRDQSEAVIETVTFLNYTAAISVLTGKS